MSASRALLSILAALLLLASCGEEPPPEKPASWQADSDALMERLATLSEAGELAAAKKVLDEILARRDGPVDRHDRARARYIEGLMAADRAQEALGQLGHISWADKTAPVAAELIATELRIHWRLLFDGERLRSGVMPADFSPDAPGGLPGGAWQERRSAFAAIRRLYQEGLPMVAAEDQRVELPADPAWMALARYAHGMHDLAAFMREAAAALADDPELALATLRLHLEEYAIGRAETIAEDCLHDAAAPEAVAAFADLRRWQLLRRRMAERLPLWRYDELEARLEALAERFPEADAAAQAWVDAQADINREAMSVGQRLLEEVEVEIEVEDPIRDHEPVATTAIWTLATHWDGLDLSVPRGVISAGDRRQVHLSSRHHGTHQLRLYRLDDRATWDALCTDMDNAALPGEAIKQWRLETKDDIGLPALEAGLYAITAQVRGCPVVVVKGLQVARYDLHLRSGRSRVLAWAIDRQQARGAVGVPLRFEFELVRNVERAGGLAWRQASPAWRAGFRQAFTGEQEEAFLGEAHRATFEQGLAAGQEARELDPPFTTALEAQSDEQGVVDLALPERLHGRAYRLRCTLLDEASLPPWEAAFGADAAWSAKALAWADKPYARPGDGLRFKAILRDWNGRLYRRPEGSVPVRIEVGDETIWEQTCSIDRWGCISGELVLPPGVRSGDAKLFIDDGPGKHLAVIDREALPDVIATVEDLSSDAHRAGEDRILRLRLRDRTGEPIAGLTVQSTLSAHSLVKLPDEPVPDATSDDQGFVHLRLPTHAGTEALYRLRCSFALDDSRTWYVEHDWHTSAFPFPLQVELREQRPVAGEALPVAVKLPEGAAVELRIAEQNTGLGESLTVQGNGDWQTLRLPTSTAWQDRRAHLEVSAPTLDGERARRLIQLNLHQPQAAEAELDDLQLHPERHHVEPGEELPLEIGSAQPGRSLLLLAAAYDPLHHRLVELAEARNRCTLTVGSDWAPQIHLEGVCWIEGRGFVSTRRQTIEVLPVDRLLKVAAVIDRHEPRPGDELGLDLQVRDWRGQARAGVALSIGVVDERVYQLADDRTPDLLAYFHRYQRPFELVTGQADRLPPLDRQFWKAIAWHWSQESDEFRGGSRMAFGRHGGSRRSLGLTGKPLIGGSADPTIHWLATVVSDETGAAHCRFRLPEEGGSWRITVRAADQQDRIMVGELRTSVQASHPYDGRLVLPACVSPGDRLTVQAEIVNHEPVARQLQLRCGDSEQMLELAPKQRRLVQLPITVAAADGPWARLGERLGRVQTVELIITDAHGADPVTRRAETLVLAPGLPSHARHFLSADETGRLRIPGLPATGIAALTLRAWPDAARRVAERLARERGGSDALACAAWLLSTAGPERRAELAKRWPRLGQDLFDALVRQVAFATGNSADGGTVRSSEALGQWLLARGRAIGLDGPAPRRRAPHGSNEQRLLLAATARLEGWPGAAADWRQLREQLDDARQLAIYLDTAELIGESGLDDIRARLAGSPWHDDLTTLLACLHLQGDTREVAAEETVRISRGGEAVASLPATSAGAGWIGPLDGGLELRAAPGSLLAIELLVQHDERPSCEAIERSWCFADGPVYRTLAEGPLPLDWPLALRLVNSDAQERELLVPIPAALRYRPATGTLRLVTDLDHRFVIPEEDRERLGNLLQGGDPDFVDHFATLLRALPATAEEELTGHAHSRAKVGRDRLLRLRLGAGEACLLPFEATGAGRLTVGGFASRRLGSESWEGLPPMTIETAMVSPPLPEPPTGHPLATSLVAAMEAGDQEERGWLLQNLVEDPQRALSVLDPAAQHDLDDLADHPHAGQPGHWTTDAIRAFISGEPAFDRRSWEYDLIPDPVAAEERELSEVIMYALNSRNDSARARELLRGPQPFVATSRHALRDWARAMTGLAEEELDRWFWQQTCEPEAFSQLGYTPDLAGWQAFLAQECGLDLRIADDIPQRLPGEHGGRIVLHDFPDGQLGCQRLLAAGLSVAPAGDGYELRVHDRRKLPRLYSINLRWTDMPTSEALPLLAELGRQRGYSLSYAHDPDSDRPLTLHVDDLPFERAVEFVALMSGLSFERQGSQLKVY